MRKWVNNTHKIRDNENKENVYFSHEDIEAAIGYI